MKKACIRLKKINKNISYLNADVSKSKSHLNIFKKCKEKFGDVDILINNAGGPPMGTLLEIDESQWQEALETNLLSVIRFLLNMLLNL